jgi:hypothetical protein
MANPQMFVKVVSSGEQLLVKGINEALDGVVDDGGSGTFETLQAADDVLDAAAYSLWVKQGTYSAGLTVSTDNIYIFVEPGTIIQAAITLSGTGITLVLGAQCDIQGLITLSGVNCSLICQGGVDIDGILVSGNTCLVDGGGWDTLTNGGAARHAISVTGDDCIIKDIAVQTTAGGGTGYDGVNTTGSRITLSRIKVIDSDNAAFELLTGSDLLIEGCSILGADGQGIYLDGPRYRVVGNYMTATGADGIEVAGSGDGATIIGNVVQDPTSISVVINANGEDCLVVGNKLDGAVTDNSGTSTVASNEVTAF